MDMQEVIGAFIGIFIIIVLFGTFINVLIPFGIGPIALFVVSTIALIGVIIYSLVRK